MCVSAEGSSVGTEEHSVSCPNSGPRSLPGAPPTRTYVHGHTWTTSPRGGGTPTDESSSTPPRTPRSCSDEDGSRPRSPVYVQNVPEWVSTYQSGPPRLESTLRRVRVGRVVPPGSKSYGVVGDFESVPERNFFSPPDQTPSDLVGSLKNDVSGGTVGVASRFPRSPCLSVRTLGVSSFQ